MQSIPEARSSQKSLVTDEMRERWLAADYSPVSLKRSLNDPSSPYREYMRERFPNRTPLGLQYTNKASRIIVGQGEFETSWNGIIGHAMRVAVAFLADPRYRSHEAVEVLSTIPGGVKVLDDLEVVIRNAILSGDVDAMVRGCFSIGSCIDGFLNRHRKLEELVADGVLSVEAMIESAPDEQCDQVRQMLSLSWDILIEGSINRAKCSMLLDPSNNRFGSVDFLCDGRAISIRTRTGTKSGGRNHTGAIRRVDSVTMVDLYTIASHALILQDEVTSVGFYGARYGALSEWDANDMLRFMAGCEIDVQQERDFVHDLLVSRVESKR